MYLLDRVNKRCSHLDFTYNPCWSHEWQTFAACGWSWDGSKEALLPSEVL